MFIISGEFNTKYLIIDALETSYTNKYLESRIIDDDGTLLRLLVNSEDLECL